jgi:hypothetical protein
LRVGLNEAITYTAGVDFTAGPGSELTTTIGGSPTRIVADGASTSTITVQTPPR